MYILKAKVKDKMGYGRPELLVHYFADSEFKGFVQRFDENGNIIEELYHFSNEFFDAKTVEVEKVERSLDSLLKK